MNFPYQYPGGEQQFSGEWANPGGSQYAYGGEYGGSYEAGYLHFGGGGGGSGSSITLENPHQAGAGDYIDSYNPYNNRRHDQPYAGGNVPRSRDAPNQEDDFRSYVKFACIFHTICMKRFVTRNEWIEHIRAHFPGDFISDAMPKAWQCRFPNCRSEPIQSHSPYTVWMRKLGHIAEHLEGGEDIRTMQEEHSYLTLYRELGLVQGVNSQYGVSTAQMFRDGTQGRHQPDFSRAQEFEQFNAQAQQRATGQRMSEGNTQYPQDPNPRYPLQRAQTIPMSANNPGSHVDQSQSQPPLPSYPCHDQGPHNLHPSISEPNMNHFPYQNHFASYPQSPYQV